MDQARIAELLKRFPPKELATGNLRTPPGRASYPSLFEKSRPTETIKEEKYKLTLLFPKQADIRPLAAALVRAAVEAGVPAAKAQALARERIMDQGKKADKAGYEPGCFYITAKSDNKPGVVGPNGKPLTDPSSAPAGYWMIATVNAYYYKDPVPGVSLGLQNVAVVAEDEPFGAVAPPPDEEFGDVLDGLADPNELFGGSEGAGNTNGAVDPFAFG